MWGSEVWDLGFWVLGLGVGGRSLRFEAWNWGLGFGVWGLGFGVWDLVFELSGLVFGVWRSKFGRRGLRFGFWVLSFGVYGEKRIGREAPDLGVGGWGLVFSV